MTEHQIDRLTLAVFAAAATGFTIWAVYNPWLLILAIPAILGTIGGVLTEYKQ